MIIGFFRDILFNKRIRVFTLVVIILFGALQIQSTLRAESAGEETDNVFIITFIKYHVAGFVLFDLELQDENSVLNKKPTYGLGVFGGIERFIAFRLSMMAENIEL